jgi:hypothetical protein
MGTQFFIRSPHFEEMLNRCCCCVIVSSILGIRDEPSSCLWELASIVILGVPVTAGFMTRKYQHID